MARIPASLMEDREAPGSEGRPTDGRHSCQPSSDTFSAAPHGPPRRGAAGGGGGRRHRPRPARAPSALPPGRAQLSARWWVRGEAALSGLCLRAEAD